MNICVPSNSTFNVTLLDDGAKFAYGTKQRVIIDYLQQKIVEGYTEFVYAGPVNAMGAFALAQGCKELRLRCRLFLVGTKLTAQARGFSRNIQLIRGPLTEADQQASDYVQMNAKRFLVPFGIQDSLYKSILKASIEADADLQTLQPKRLWLAVGSGALLSILLDIFPTTHFRAVQVGKSLKLETFSAEAQARITTYWSPERFTQPAQQPPPYCSLIN